MQASGFSLFTIFDTKTQTYRAPVIAKDETEIFRQLENNFSNPSTQYDPYVTHAEDFQLFKVGSFDEKTAKITPEITHVVNLHELKAAALQRLKFQERALSAT